jgi:hypothetical protein
MPVDLNIKIQVPGELSPHYRETSSLTLNVRREKRIGEKGIDSIKDWIKNKISRGVTFKVPKSSNGKDRGTLSSSDDVNIGRLAFGIANKIFERGLKTRTDFDKPFQEIGSVMNKAKIITEKRVKLLMTEQAIPIMQNAFLGIGV